MPSWVVEKALRSDHYDNWREEYTLVKDLYVPLNANEIASHVVYKVKKEEDEILLLKERIRPNGKRYTIEFYVQNYCATAKFGVIRLMLAVVTFIPFRLGCLYIRLLSWRSHVDVALVNSTL